MALQGRPFGSKIRKNIVNLLFLMGKGYGYEIHKYYIELFVPCTREVIYYNLKKGLQTEEFKLDMVKIEQGNFSWGPQTRKLIYSLGKLANPNIDLDLKSKFDELVKKNKK